MFVRFFQKSISKLPEPNLNSASADSSQWAGGIIRGFVTGQCAEERVFRNSSRSVTFLKTVRFVPWLQLFSSRVSPILKKWTRLFFVRMEVFVLNKVSRQRIALQKTVSNLKFGWQGFINPMSSQFLKRVLFVICVVHIWLSFCVKKRRPGSIYWSVSSILSTVWAEWGFVLKSLQFGIRVLSTYRESKKRLVRKIFKIANISFLS